MYKQGIYTGGRASHYPCHYQEEYLDGALERIDLATAIHQLYFVEKILKMPYDKEVVAIAQSYKDCGYTDDDTKQTAGWTNKMFVRADLMPHHIKIERIRVERLQDISEEDALKEGVCFYENTPITHRYDHYTPWSVDIKPYKYDADNQRYYATARYAFACLIDKTAGKGTWNENPFVFVYDFKLID